MARKKRKGRGLDGVLLLSKPVGISSNRALQRAIQLFGACKAGHTGSLDPLASGMLPICFGEATKIAGFLLNADKAYTVTAQLGVTTNTGDLDGEVLLRVPANTVDGAALEAVLNRFRGPIKQIPPMYSALKYRGQPLYKLARQGLEIERKVRCVTISQLDLLHFENAQLSLYVECSKGTYIRSLIIDIGALLGCGAHVIKLHRNWVRPFAERPMHTLDEIELLPGSDFSCIDDLLLEPNEALTLPVFIADEKNVHRLLKGQTVTCETASEIGTLYTICTNDQRFLGIGLCKTPGSLAPRRLVRVP